MQTAYITHPLCIEHKVGDQHPEFPARITAIEKQLIADGLMELLSRYKAPPATNEQLLQAHEEGYIDSIELAIPKQCLEYCVFPVSFMCCESGRSREYGLGKLAT